MTVGRVAIEGDFQNPLWKGKGVFGEISPTYRTGSTPAACALSQRVAWHAREVTVELTNFGSLPVVVKRGQNIAVWTPCTSEPETVFYATTAAVDRGEAPPLPAVMRAQTEARAAAAAAGKARGAPPAPGKRDPVRGASGQAGRRQQQAGARIGEASSEAGMAEQPRAAEAPSEAARAAMRTALHAKVDANSLLDAGQRTRLKALLDDFVDCFGDQLAFAGEARLPGGVKVEHRIHTEGPPTREAPRREAPSARATMEEQVANFERMGAIEDSASPYAAPVVMVRKKDGTWRFCIDYRRLNRQTRRDAYPLPCIDDILDRVSGVQFISKLDAVSAYQQIPIAEEDCEKTAFTIWGRLLQWRVMPFGLTNCPPTFQRFMDVLLSGLNWRCCVVYLDDIVVFSNSFEDHLVHLRAVLERVRASGVKLKTSKCDFCSDELVVLGHIVGRDGVKVDPEKTRAVSNLAPPADVKELRQFLGLAGYYRRFVRGFSEISAPLDRLLRKDEAWTWGAAQQGAFNRLKRALIEAPVLRPPNWSRPFRLFTDANGLAIAAVLTQVDEYGREYMVAYGSKALSDAQRKWSVTELECYAVVHFTRVFRAYLEGSHFQVVTDHAALKWLASCHVPPTPRLQRWALALGALDMDVVHRAGRLHLNADPLTRLPVAPEVVLAVCLAVHSEPQAPASDSEREASEVEEDEDRAKKNLMSPLQSSQNIERRRPRTWARHSSRWC